MNASAPNTLLFSTITRKAQAVTDHTQKTNLTKSVTSFKDLALSRDKELTSIIDPYAKYNPSGDPQRPNLIFTDQVLSFIKKSKKTGKPLQRTAKFAPTDVSHIVQEKNKKEYITPAKITPETCTEYEQRMAGATAAEKKLILPWALPKVPGKGDYRVAFVRRPDPKKPDASVDSAFYFDNKEEWTKVKNYLKFIELLETREGGTKPNMILANLNKAFKGHLALKFRKLMAIRANQVRKERLVIKETLVRNSRVFLQINPTLWRLLTDRWLRLTRDQDALKRDRERALRDRAEMLANTIKRSSLILTLNSYLVGAMLEAWKNEAEARIQSYKEDVVLYLNCVEIASTIIQPSLKVEVTVAKEYPDDLVINNYRIRDRTLERTLDFRVNCKIKGPKTPQVYYWKIVPAEILQGDRSDRYSNPDDNPFTLRFNDFILEYLDLIEIRFQLYDESENVRAQQYASLKNLYAASKKGNNIWLSMNTKGNLKSPLLHVKTFSCRADTNQELVFDVNKDGVTNLDTIQDTFYNYHFDMPPVTPKHDKLLELLPRSWNIVDENIKSLKRDDQAASFVNTVKSRLAKHYYENASRQIARSQTSAQLWAKLQDELTSYIPKQEAGHISQLYVDENYIKNLAGLQKPVIDENQDNDNSNQDFQEEYNGIVSYLFKRDKWETKDEWNKFYQKLGFLCKKGLPPQHRLNIWSELSRVVYFVNLTENEHKKQRGVRFYKQAYMDQDMGERSRTVDNIYKKSKMVYDQLKEDAEKEYIYLYQELEDDLDFLREQFETSEKHKIPCERHIRSICRTFIFWSKMFSDPSTEEKIRYFVTYSRAILILCHGLITCQTSSYLEKDVHVEEEQIFWNLVSLSTYIVSNYFETNEDSVSVDKLTFKQGEDLDRKKNKITNSALRCNHMRGIKGDLLILKILLKEYEPEIYYKFEELGLPLEFYFADHMLTLFFNLFNPGLTFRIWDVLFFEGSSTNQVRCNRMIVCFLYVLLKNCKPMLLSAKKASDISFIIQTYGRFETKYGAFIKEAYNVSRTYFQQALPKDDTILEKLSFIRYALFTSEYNKLDKKIVSIERLMEDNYFTFTLQQNMALFALTNNKYEYRYEEPETLPYSVLAHMIREFQNQFGAKTDSRGAVTKEGDYLDEPEQKKYKVFQDVNIDTRRFLKGRMSSLHFRVHSLVTAWPNLEDLSLVVVYGKEKQKKKDLQNLNIEFEGYFTMSNARDIPRYLNLEILDERDPTNPQKLKYLSIDLKRLAFEAPIKLNLKFREENPDIYNNNHITSEVGITLLLEGAETPAPTNVDFGVFFIVPELENPIYQSFREKDFSHNVVSGHDHEGEVERKTFRAGAEFMKDRHAWKENFAVEYEEFLKIIKQLAPFWTNVDFSKIYSVIANANRNTTFYITDFFVLLILYGKFTSIQKFGLLFDLFTGFDDTFTDKTREIPYHVLRGLCAYLYDVFMVYMPYNELENIIDLSVYGNTATIKKVTINHQVTPKGEIVKQHLNRLSNYIHATFNTRELHLYQDQVLSVLRNVYEKEVSQTLDQQVNKVEISYLTNGMVHKLQFDIDQNWKLLEDAGEGRKSTKAGMRLLANYRAVISLQNTPKIFNKVEFTKIMQKLPLINYLCSLEHTEISNTLQYLTNVRFTVNMEGEPVYTAIPTNEIITKEVLTNADELLRKKKKNFRTILKEWSDISKNAGYKSGSMSNIQTNRSNTFRGARSRPNLEVHKLPFNKLNLFVSYNQLISSIKRAMMKTVADAIDKSNTNADQFHPAIFHRNLWELDFAVNITVNGNRDFEITDKKKSPFKTLVELMERSSSRDRDIEQVEIIYNLKNSIIPGTFFEPYNQLGVYRYAEGSTEWLPCKIKYKFEYLKREENPYYRQNRIDGFGVVFTNFPDETVLKRANEIAIVKPVDFEELELKQVDAVTSKAKTIDRIATDSSPNRAQPKVLFQKPSYDDEEEDENLFGSSKPVQSGFGSGQKVRSGSPGIYDGMPREDEYEEQFGGRFKVKY